MKPDSMMYQELSVLLAEYGTAKILNAIAASAEACADVVDAYASSQCILFADMMRKAAIPALCSEDGDITIARGAEVMSSLAEGSEREEHGT